MDNTYDEDNTYNDYYDAVRSPDRVYSDQLLDTPIAGQDSFEDQIRAATDASLSEWNQQNAMNAQFEYQLIQEYVAESKSRREKFEVFLRELIRLSKFDKDIALISDFLIEIIEGYCNQTFNVYHVTGAEYDNLFRILSTIRNCPLDHLRTIIKGSQSREP